MKYRYFDYAAATPMSTAVKTAMEPYFCDDFYNPSALYQPARELRQRIDQARSSVARQLGVNASGVYFTAGVTEANNLMLQGVAQAYPGSTMIVSAIEHESVAEPAQLLQERGLAEVRTAPVDAQGRIKLAELMAMIDETTVLISALLVNNETGVIQDTAALGQLRDKVEAQRADAGSERPLIIHSDVAQAPGVMPLKLNRLGLDAVSLSAAKMYGPKQSAALALARPLKLTPLIVGGTQERGVRAGTENVANIIGFEAALSETAGQRSQHVQQLQQLQQQFESELRQQFPEVVVHSEKAKRAPHLSSVVIPGVSDGERLVMELAERGFLAATGSACTAGSGQPSAIIGALGASQAEAAATLRVSFGRMTEESDVTQLVEALDAVIHKGLV